MLIKAYVRIKTYEYIRPLLIKNKCEICGEINGLELHHIIPFATLYEQCLKSLGYKDYKNKNNYSQEQKENIINWMLGIQLKIEYLTLCEECHKNLHMINGGFYNINENYNKYIELEKIKKQIQEEIKLKENIIPYLNNIIGKKLYKEDQEELINIIDLKDSRGRMQKSISQLNNYFNINNIKLILKSKRKNIRINEKVKKDTYWILNN